MADNNASDGRTLADTEIMAVWRNDRDRKRLGPEDVETGENAGASDQVNQIRGSITVPVGRRQNDNRIKRRR